MSSSSSSSSSCASKRITLFSFSFPSNHWKCLLSLVFSETRQVHSGLSCLVLSTLFPFLGSIFHCFCLFLFFVPCFSSLMCNTFLDHFPLPLSCVKWQALTGIAFSVSFCFSFLNDVFLDVCLCRWQLGTLGLICRCCRRCTAPTYNNVLCCCSCCSCCCSD